MNGDPADSELVVSGHGLGADLRRGGGEALAGDDGVGTHSVDGGREVREGGVTVAALLVLVQDAEGSVDGEHLRAENLFVRAKAAAIASPSTRALPHARRPETCSEGRPFPYRGLLWALATSMAVATSRSCIQALVEAHLPVVEERPG